MQKKDQEMQIEGLGRFSSQEDLPGSDAEVRAVMHSERVKKVIIFALGPEGTNIEQCSHKWLDRLGLSEKGDVVLCPTPEISALKAREINEEGVVPLFVTCAVFYGEAEMFFTNFDLNMFFTLEYMDLDRMQMATRPEMVENLEKAHRGDKVVISELPKFWRIASHPSPKYLVFGLCTMVDAKSNAHAARMCESGEVTACITTEKARKEHGLVTLHDFGAPPMVFFFGTTPHGEEVVRRAFQETIM